MPGDAARIRGRGTISSEGYDQAEGDATRPVVRVLLADDHTMFRQGLASILASYGGMEVVGEVPNDAEALGLAREFEPDVVIMQVQLPFERAKETLRQMRAFPRPPKVGVVTMRRSPAT